MIETDFKTTDSTYPGTTTTVKNTTAIGLMAVTVAVMVSLSILVTRKK